MKAFLPLSIIAALFTANVSAQTGPEYLTITIAANSIQQPVVMTMEFSGSGENAFDLRDTTTIGAAVIGDPANSGDSLLPPPTNYIAPFTMSSDNVFIDQFDSRPNFDTYTSFPFGVTSFLTDTITISVSTFFGIDSLNASANAQINYVYLEDTLTGMFYQLLNENATLVIPVNSAQEMNYVLHVMAKPIVTTAPVTCFGDNNGAITIQNPFCSGWNYTIYASGNPVRSSCVSDPDTTLSNFTSQVYTVVVYINNLLADSGNVNVGSPVQVIAGFVADNYSVFSNSSVSFTNQSSGATIYSWTFGDSSIDSVANPTHSFSSEGNYPVTLVATNSNGCSASFTDTIYVTSPPMYQGPHFLLINDPSNDPDFSNDPALRKNNSPDVTITGSQQKITVNQNAEAQKLFIQIVNMNGQLISSASATDQSVTVEVPCAGIYIVSIAYSNGEIVSEKVLVNNY